MPCDGPREMRLPGWLGSTAQISDPSAYVMQPCTDAYRSDGFAAPDTHSCGADRAPVGVTDPSIHCTDRRPARMLSVRSKTLAAAGSDFDAVICLANWIPGPRVVGHSNHAFNQRHVASVGCHREQLAGPGECDPRSIRRPRRLAPI